MERYESIIGAIGIYFCIIAISWEGLTLINEGLGHCYGQIINGMVYEEAIKSVKGWWVLHAYNWALLFGLFYYCFCDSIKHYWNRVFNFIGRL